MNKAHLSIFSWHQTNYKKCDDFITFIRISVLVDWEKPTVYFVQHSIFCFDKNVTILYAVKIAWAEFDDDIRRLEANEPIMSRVDMSAELDFSKWHRSFIKSVLVDYCHWWLGLMWKHACWVYRKVDQKQTWLNSDSKSVTVGRNVGPILTKEIEQR